MTDDHHRQEAEKRPEADVDFPISTEDNSKPETDWGLKKPQSGMSKEIKIVATALVLICGFFAYVLYSKTSDTTAENAAVGETENGEDPAPETEPPIKLVKNDTLQNLEAEDQAQPLDLTVVEPDPAAHSSNGHHQANDRPHRAQSDYRRQLEQRMADAGHPSANETDPFQGQDDWENQANNGHNHLQEHNPNRNELPPRQNLEFTEDDSAGLTGLEDGENIDTFETASEAEELVEESHSTNGTDHWDFPEDQETAQGFDGEQSFDRGNIADDDAGNFNDTDFAGQGDHAPPMEQRGVAGGHEHHGPETELSEEHFHDPRTGRYHGVTPHSGRASSTTIVRRAEEPHVENETDFTDPAQSADRFSGYRSVGNYHGHRHRQSAIQNSQAAPDQFEDEVAEEFDGRSDQAQQEQNTFNGDSLADDNRDFDFENHEHHFGAHRHHAPGQNLHRHDGDSHVVETNDSFWSIARQTYGNAKYFQALAKYNEHTIPEPRAMRPGVVIETPPATELERLYPEMLGGVKQATRLEAADRESYGSTDYAEDEEFHGRAGYRPSRSESPDQHAADAQGFFVTGPGRPRYRVSSGDNLGSIARRHLGKASRWEEIYRLNEDRLADPHRLKIGTILRLPPDARRERVVARPVFGR